MSSSGIVPKEVRLSSFSGALAEAGQELDQIPQDELRQKSLTSLVQRDLRSRIESTSKQTKCGFPQKPYFRLAEILIDNFFDPGGIEKLIKVPLDEERTKLQSMKVSLKTLIKQILAFIIVDGKADVSQWDDQVSSLAQFIVTNLTPQVLNNFGGNLQSIPNALDSLIKIQNESLFAHYETLMSIIKSNFSTLDAAPIFLIQEPNSNRHPDDLAEVVQLVLIADLVLVTLRTSYDALHAQLLLQENMTEISKLIRNIKAPRPNHYSTIQRASAANDGNTTLQMRNDAQISRDLLIQLSTTYDAEVARLEYMSGRHAARCHHLVDTSLINEALFYTWHQKLFDAHDRWDARMQFFALLYTYEARAFEESLVIFQNLWSTLGLNHDVSGAENIDDTVRSKIELLRPFLNHDEYSSPRQNGSNSSSVDNVATVPVVSSHMDRPNRLFEQVTQEVDSWKEHPENYDLYEVQNVLRQVTRCMNAIADAKSKINAIGSGDSDTSQLEEYEDQLNDFRVLLDRKEAALNELCIQKREIEKISISSQRTKFPTWKGGPPTLFLLWQKPILDNFSALKYPDKSERLAKIKSFLDMKAYPDYERLIDTVKDPDDLLQFLQDSFGSLMKEKSYYLKQVKSLKKSHDLGDDSMILQELMMIKSSLIALDELNIVGEDVLTEYIIPKFTPDTAKKWQIYKSEPEYKKLQERLGKGIQDIRPSIIPEREYRLSPEEVMSRFWQFVHLTSFQLASELNKKTQSLLKEKSNKTDAADKKHLRFRVNAFTGEEKKEKKVPHCSFLNCTDQKTHWPYKCPKNISPNLKQDALHQAIKSQICCRCLRSTKEEDQYPTPGLHKCDGFISFYDKATKKLKKKSTDCKCNGSYKNQKLHYLICRCRLKPKQQQQQQPPTKANKNDKRKVCYQVTYYDDGSSSTDQKSPWHKTPEENVSSIRSPPMPHYPTVGENLGVPNNYPPTGQATGSRVPQPWTASGESTPTTIAPRVAQMWYHSDEALSSAIPNSFNALTPDEIQKYGFDSPANSGKPTTTLHWKKYDCLPVSDVGVLIDRQEIERNSALTFMKLQGRSQSKTEKIYKNKNKIGLPDHKSNSTVPLIPQLSPGEGSLWLEWIPILCLKTNQFVMKRSLSDSGSNCDLLDLQTGFDMQLPHRKIANPYHVNTAHGRSLIQYEFMVTFRIFTGVQEEGMFTEKKGVFLGFSDLKATYPAYRLQIPSSFRKHHGIEERELVQPRGDVVIVMGSGSSIMFPRVILHQGTTILARSAVSGKLLCQGARIMDAKVPHRIVNALQVSTPLQVDLDPLAEDLLNQVLGVHEDEDALEVPYIPDLTDSENSDSSDSEEDEYDSDNEGNGQLPLPQMPPLIDHGLDSDDDSDDEIEEGFVSNQVYHKLFQVSGDEHKGPVSSVDVENSVSSVDVENSVSSVDIDCIVDTKSSASSTATVPRAINLKQENKINNIKKQVRFDDTKCAHVKNCNLNKISGVTEATPDGEYFLDECGFFKKYSSDSIGFPVNKNCARCTKCSCREMTESEKDALVTAEMEKQIEFDPSRKTRKFSGKYIYKQPPDELDLPDNSQSSLKDAKRLSARLKKLGKTDCDTFNKQVKKAVDNHAIQKILPGMFKGLPSRWNPSCYSFSGKELSTPIRFCADPSRDDGAPGSAYNQLTLKGTPGNNLIKIFLQIRTHRYASLSDLSGAYHQVRLSELDGSLRRLWVPHDKLTGELAWGQCESSVDWIPYFWSSAAFGDIGASAVLFLVIKRAAEMFSSDQDVKRWLRDFSYVDDILSCGATQIERDHIQAGIEHVLNEAGLKHCEWFKIEHPAKELSGPPSLDELQQLKKIFGMSYLEKRDRFILTPSINLYTFLRGRPTGPPLHPGQNVGEYCDRFIITKRLLARVAMSIFDLSGFLIIPQMMNRIFFSRALVFEENLTSWDSVISSEMKEFVKNVEMLMSLQGFTWPRSALPKDGYKSTSISPLLAIPVDGSDSASCAIAYLVTEKNDHDITKSPEFPNNVSILRSCGKVASASGESVPRLEATGLVLGCKLAEQLLKDLPFPVEKVVFLSDSTTVILQTMSRHLLLQPWLLSRMRYIKSQLTVSQLYKVASDKNSSDLPTKMPRGGVRDAMESHKFLSGEFMDQPFDEWPISHLDKPKKMDEVEGVHDRYKLFSNHLSCEINEGDDETGGLHEDETEGLPEIRVVGDNMLPLHILPLDHEDSLQHPLPEDTLFDGDLDPSNPVENIYNQLSFQKFFGNPEKRHAGRAQRIKKKSVNPNKNPDFLSEQNVKKAEELVKSGECEFFAQPKWKVKVYSGEKGEKNGGKYEIKYQSFFERRRNFKKLLTSLGIAISWVKKFRNTPMEMLRDHITTVLAKASTPHVILMLDKMRQKEVTHFMDGVVKVQHRRLLQNSLPEFSIILSPESGVAKAIAVSLHESFHLMDTRSFASILRREKVSIHIPRLTYLLKKLDEQCVTCRLRLSTPSFAQQGALPLMRTSPRSAWSAASLDLTGPISIQEPDGRRSHKCWIGILVCKSSGLLYADLLQDYSAGSVDMFLETFESNFCSKIYFLEVDSGSHFVGLRQSTNKQVMGRLRSETRQNALDDERQLQHSEEELMEQYVTQLRLSSARRGYKLKFAPANCHHRLGSCERMVNMLKNYFRDLPSHKVLSHLQLQLLLKRFSWLQNSRPITRDGSHFLTRAHILSGRETSFAGVEEEGDPVASSREFKNGVDEVEAEHAQLFQEFFLLQESGFLQMNRNKFSSSDLPRKGDLVHVRSLPNYSNYSLAFVIHLEASADGVSRNFWLRIMRSRGPQHPYPLAKSSTQPEIFRRDAQDLVLLMRAEEMSLRPTSSLSPDLQDEKIDEINDTVVEEKDDEPVASKDSAVDEVGNGNGNATLTQDDFLNNLKGGGDNMIVPSITDPGASGDTGDDTQEPLDTSDDSEKTVLWEDDPLSPNTDDGKEESDSEAETIPWRDDFDEAPDNDDSIDEPPEMQRRQRRDRPPPGYFRNMKIFAILQILLCLFSIFIPNVEGFDFAKRPRHLSNMCKSCDPDYYQVMKSLQMALETKKEWLESLKLTVKDQISLYKDLPLVQLPTPSSMTVALRHCTELGGDIVEFHNYQDYQQLEKLAKDQGYASFLGHITLDSTARPEWGGSSTPYTVSSDQVLIGMVKYINGVKYNGGVRWDLSNKKDRNILKDYISIIGDDVAIYCHLDDTPFFNNVRGFNLFAAQKLSEMAGKDPQLEDVATVINEVYDKSEDEDRYCNPCRFDLISPTHFLLCKPRQYFKNTATLELQSLSLTKFTNEYNLLRKELRSSLEFLQDHHELTFEVVFSGSTYYILTSNYGYNAFTLMLALASIPFSMFVFISGYYSYKLTCKPESCTRYWLEKFSIFFLRTKIKRSRAMKASIEDSENPQLDNLIQASNNVSTAVVPRNRYEVDAFSRRSAREYRGQAPLPPYRPREAIALEDFS